MDRNTLQNHFDQGLLSFQKGDFESALKKFKFIIIHKEKESKIMSLISICYHKLKNSAEAERFINLAIKSKPEEIGYYLNKGSMMVDNNEYARAEIFYVKTLKDFSNSSLLYYNMGVLQTNLNEHKKANELFKKSTQIDPNNKHTLNGLASSYKEIGMLNNAKKILEEIILQDDLFIIAKYNLGLIHLLQENFDDGWLNYEFRTAQDNDYLKNLKKNKIRKWNGTSLENKKLIIYTEQGFGDCIQFIRYIREIKKKNTLIYLYTNNKIEYLLSDIPEIDFLIFDYNKIPVGDFYISLMSLPFILKNKKGTLDPYNFFPKNETKNLFWKLKIKKIEKIKIGLMWQGSVKNKNDYKRSISLFKFQEILKLNKFNFISLQKSEGQEQIKKYNLQDKITDYYGPSTDINPFEDTIEIIKNLDLVITVDTSIAHIASTLGKETWVLLPFIPDFRWGLKKQETEWYKSMRLFRQKELNIWENAILEIKKSLIEKFPN